MSEKEFKSIHSGLKMIRYVLVAVVAGIVFNVFFTRSKLKEIDYSVHLAIGELDSIKVNVNGVINSLSLSSALIDSVLYDMKKSKPIFEKILQESSALSKSESEQIKRTLEKLQRDQLKIQKEKEAFETLLLKLNDAHQR